MPVSIPLLLLSVVPVALLAIALTPSRPVWLRTVLLLAAGLTWPLATALVNPVFRILSNHGMVHAGIIYAVLRGGVPPEDPCFAGHVVNYYWTYHALLAGVVWVLRISPAWAVAMLNVACMVIALLLLRRAGAWVIGDDLGGAMGVTFALLSLPLLCHLVHPVFPLSPLGIPILQKFCQANGMPPGLAAFALGLYSLLRVLGDPPRSPLSYLWLFAATLLAGVFYAPIWVGWVAIVYAASGAALLVRGRPLFGRAAAAVALVTAASLAALPVVRLMGADRNPDVGVGLAHDPANMLARAAQQFLPMVPFALVALWRRRDLRDLYRRNPVGTAVLAAVILTTGLLGVIVHVPGETWYKWRALGLIALGLLVAEPMKQISLKARWAWYPLLVVFILPAGIRPYRKITDWRVPIDPIVERGVSYQHGDPAEQRLYDWILADTPPDAIFIDTQLSVPVFGQRSLYAANDVREAALRQKLTPRGRIIDGYGYSGDVNMRVVKGYPPAEIDARMHLIAQLYAPAADLDDDARRTLARAALERPLYVVVRDPTLRPKFEALAGFQEAFASDRASVWRYAPQEPPSRSSVPAAAAPVPAIPPTSPPRTSTSP